MGGLMVDGKAAVALWYGFSYKSLHYSRFPSRNVILVLVLLRNLTLLLLLHVKLLNFVYLSVAFGVLTLYYLIEGGRGLYSLRIKMRNRYLVAVNFCGH